MSRIHDHFLDTTDLTREQLESFGSDCAVFQRGVNWWIGDIARYAKYGLKLGDNYAQVFPEWVSPGLIQRCEKVALAYPKESDRNPLATWTDADVAEYAREHDLPEHPLADRGYASIGCWPCTRPVDPGDAQEADNGS